MKTLFIITFIVLFLSINIKLIGQEEQTYSWNAQGEEEITFPFSDEQRSGNKLKLKQIGLPEVDSIQLDGNKIDEQLKEKHFFKGSKGGKEVGVLNVEKLLTDLNKAEDYLTPEKEVTFSFTFFYTGNIKRIFKYEYAQTDPNGNTEEETTNESLTVDLDTYFIPKLYDDGKGDWPNFLSERNQNIKYRFAIDFSQSYSQASVWKLRKVKKDADIDECTESIIQNGKKYYYKRKKTIRPSYLRFMSLSVKNYFPRYDSINTTMSYDSYNLEGRSLFEKYQKNIVSGHEPKGLSGDEDMPGRESTGDLDSIQQQKLALLKKLNLELLTYSSFLNRNILDMAIWKNDVQFINNKLNIHFGLTNFSVSGLRMKLEEFSKDIDVELKHEIIYEIVVYYANILSYSILTTAPVQIEDEDVLTYKLDFFKEGKKVESRNYSFLISGGFKIDYSSGFTYSSLSNAEYQIIGAGHINDTTFYVDPDFNTTDSITAITPVNQSSIQLMREDISVGVSALMHFYTRMGRMVNMGGTFGFMLNTNAEFNYLLGGSIILGQQQRFIVSGGASIGQVDRLNPKYQTDVLYPSADLANLSDEQLTVKEWDFGYFIGISYNLGRIK